MDSARFDHLARSLGRPASRRGALGVLAGGLALLGEAVPGLARRRKRKGKGKKKPPAEALVCHNGETLLVPREAVRGVLLDGGTEGACSDVEGAFCLPLAQICVPAQIPCCPVSGAPFGAMLCEVSAFPTGFTCKLRCDDDAGCQRALGYQDVGCHNDFLECPLGACCRPNVCSSNSDCQSGGPCCITYRGDRRCCAPGQRCHPVGGCLNAP